MLPKVWCRGRRPLNEYACVHDFSHQIFPHLVYFVWRLPVRNFYLDAKTSSARDEITVAILRRLAWWTGASRRVWRCVTMRSSSRPAHDAEPIIAGVSVVRNGGSVGCCSLDGPSHLSPRRPCTPGPRTSDRDWEVDSTRPYGEHASARPDTLPAFSLSLCTAIPGVWLGTRCRPQRRRPSNLQP